MRERAGHQPTRWERFKAAFAEEMNETAEVSFGQVMVWMAMAAFLGFCFGMVLWQVAG